MITLTLAKWRLRLFGNTLRFRINFLYLIHHIWCRLAGQRVESKNIDHVQHLREIGLAKLDAVHVRELSSRVFEYFKKNPIKNGSGNMDRAAAMELAPLIFSALQGQPKDVLNSYYRSEFQPYWTNIMRYEAGHEQPAYTSFGYHLDDNPRELLKVFIYLNDTYESNAAFRAFDYRTTKDLIRQGFISCSEDLRLQSQKLVTPELIETKQRVFEGPQGTILIFDNNVVHRGTAPRQGYRDVVCVEVYPSAKPMSLQSLQNSLRKPILRDYPLNPFRNDMQEL